MTELDTFKTCTHLGAAIRVLRQQHGLTIVQLAQRIGWRRQAQLSQRLEVLENDNRGNLQLVRAVGEALSLADDDWQHVLSRVSYWAGLERDVPISSVVIAWENAFHRVEPSLEFERIHVAQELGRLLEHVDVFQSHCAMYHLRLPFVRFCFDATVPSPVAIQSLVDDPAHVNEGHIPLGWLLKQWDQGRMVLMGADGRPELFVTRVTGTSLERRAWVEGIHPRNRTWHQREVTLTDLGFEDSLADVLREVSSEQRHILHRRFERFIAYQRELEGLQRKVAEREHPALEGWASEWLGYSKTRVCEQWNAMVQRLEMVCAIPLSDPRWESDFSGFRWIQPIPSSTMDTWMSQRPIGMASAYRHVWLKKHFSVAFEGAIAFSHSGLTPDMLEELITSEKSR